MSEAGGSVMIPETLTYQQASSDRKFSIADTTTEAFEEVNREAPVYDDGKQAWLTIVGSWLVQFCTYGYVSAFGVYQDYYTRSFLSREPPSNISWIGSFQLFMQYIPGFIIGRAFDAGYFRYMMVIGTILQIVSMLMLSLAHQNKYYEVFLAQAVGMGLGQSLLFLPSLTIIGHYFKRRRALATGIAVSGASFGGIVWPILLNQLSRRISFPNVIRTTAALCGLMLSASNFLMKARLTTASSTSHKPSLSTVFKDSAYLVSVTSAFCINLGLFFPYFYLQLYAINRNISDTLAFYSLAILNAGGVLGRLVPNFFADKIGTYNLLLPCLFISAGLAFAMFAISSFSGVVIFGLLFGFWSGSYISLIPSLLAQLSNHAGEQGTRMGIAFSIVGISVLIGTPIEGSLLRSDGRDFTWSKSIIFCGTMISCGAIGMTFSRALFVRQGRAGGRGRYI